MQLNASSKSLLPLKEGVQTIFHRNLSQDY